MTNLKELSQMELLAHTKRAVQIERDAMLSVLEHFREIRRRSVHIELGYSSLHEFAVVELKYSDGAAYRRIKSMELCDEVPIAKEALLKDVQGTSKRECENILHP